MALDTKYGMVDNYLYLFHLQKFIVIPAFTDSVTDQLSCTYVSTTPLSRSAPIYSYQSSGPRTIRVEFNLHRDMVKEINQHTSSLPIQDQDWNDYVNYMIKAVQASALPSYDDATKMVNPPVVALRLGADIFIKGVVQGGVSVTYSYPILEGGHYANVRMGLDISEIDPFQASDVLQMGSYRGLPTDLARLVYSDKDLLPETLTYYTNDLTGKTVAY